MQAGRMRHRLRILKPVTAKDEFQAEYTDWIETAVAWAERVKSTPRFGVEVVEVFSDFTVEFNIRAAHEVDNGWRVEQLGGHLYTVTNVTPNIERGMKTLRCERVNT